MADVRQQGADLLHEARKHERAGRIPEAIARFGSAIAAAERSGEQTVLAEALRRLAILRHHGNESDEARALCRRSYEVDEQGRFQEEVAKVFGVPFEVIPFKANTQGPPVEPPRMPLAIPRTPSAA